MGVNFNIWNNFIRENALPDEVNIFSGKWWKRVVPDMITYVQLWSYQV